MSQPNDKDAIRQRVWQSLDDHAAVLPPGAAGRIPNFVDAQQAAARLGDLPEWQAARVIKANPDRAQLPVRVLALHSGKLVYMAVPRLASLEPFYRLDPTEIAPAGDITELATGAGAATNAPKVTLREMQPVDLIVCGSVAVNEAGARIGKGAGYSDIEVGLLSDAGLIGPETTIVTTVHELQVVDGPLPSESHDFRVHVIVTPDRVIRCPRGPMPGGIVPSSLTPEQRSEIPVLGILGT